MSEAEEADALYKKTLNDAADLAFEDIKVVFFKTQGGAQNLDLVRMIARSALVFEMSQYQLARAGFNPEEITNDLVPVLEAVRLRLNEHSATISRIN